MRSWEEQGKAVRLISMAELGGLWDVLGQASRRSRLCRRQLCGTHCWKEGVGTPPER